MIVTGHVPPELAQAWRIHEMGVTFTFADYCAIDAGVREDIRLIRSALSERGTRHGQLAAREAAELRSAIARGETTTNGPDTNRDH